MNCQGLLNVVHGFLSSKVKVINFCTKLDRDMLDEVVDVQTLDLFIQESEEIYFVFEADNNLAALYECVFAKCVLECRLKNDMFHHRFVNKPIRLKHEKKNSQRVTNIYTSIVLV